MIGSLAKLMEELPITMIKDELDEALSRGPVVIISPTGSGKSTQVPRWCRARGRVLVVEPRRVACRSLALRVAELEGAQLGRSVGYSVRDEHRANRDTEILFATTGVVIRMMSERGGGRLDEFATVILDEFHERSLDIDLLLALLAEHQTSRQGLAVMSATLDGVHVAEHLGGVLLEAAGRLFPVECRYLPGDALLPDLRGLEVRLLAALMETRDVEGDILVFLPGKAEIASAAQAIRQSEHDVAVLPLHGGLSLDEQTRVFRPDPEGRRKVILSTNVAETSVTVPGVGVVIDSGQVRRTTFLRGRGYLTLKAIALDSAEQRAGRAGRTGPGLCIRLWSEAALLENSTPPEVHREALTSLVLAAAACGARPEDIPFLDSPKDYAIDAARGDLLGLGALDNEGMLTERGRQIFGLPVDPALGRLLIEAQNSDGLSDVIDLVAALSVGRRLFIAPLDVDDEEEDDPRAAGCDATACIRALREKGRRRWARKLNGHVLGEARQVSVRLRRAFDLPPHDPRSATPVDPIRLARTAIAADPRCAHIARERRGRVAWSNGGTELELARESAVDARKTPAIAVLESRAVGAGSSARRKAKVIATCAIPLELRWLVDAGLGHDRLGSTALKDGAIVATIERVYARRVLDVREEVPTGELARTALRDLFLKGTVFAESLAPAGDRLEAIGLLGRLMNAGRTDDLVQWYGEELAEVLRSVRHLTLETWALERLEALGVETGDDLALLAADDLLPPILPEPVTAWLDRSFPRHLSFGDALYDIEYDLDGNEVTLRKTQGSRQEPPPLSYLPSFPGFRIVLRDRSRVFVLRG